MISANIPNETRKRVYRRDNYRCALCDSSRYIQIHHYCPRGQGGNDSVENLITLCSVCHGLVHGVLVPGLDMAPQDVEQACCEYLADIYAPDWWPYK